MFYKHKIVFKKKKWKKNKKKIEKKKKHFIHIHSFRRSE